MPDEYAAVLLKVGKQGNAASTLVDEDAGVQCDANAGIEHCAGSLEAAKVLRGLNMAEPRTFLGRYGSVSGRPRAASGQVDGLKRSDGTRERRALSAQAQTERSS